MDTRQAFNAQLPDSHQATHTSRAITPHATPPYPCLHAGKALALLAEKAEYMAATGPDVRVVAVGSAATGAQARNIALCSQLQEVHRSLGAILPRLPSTAAPALAAALDAVQV
jgi:hypothetical protein